MARLGSIRTTPLVPDVTHLRLVGVYSWKPPRTARTTAPTPTSMTILKNSTTYTHPAITDHLASPPNVSPKSPTLKPTTTPTAPNPVVQVHVRDSHLAQDSPRAHATDPTAAPATTTSAISVTTTRTLPPHPPPRSPTSKSLIMQAAIFLDLYLPHALTPGDTPANAAAAAAADLDTPHAHALEDQRFPNSAPSESKSMRAATTILDTSW